VTLTWQGRPLVTVYPQNRSGLEIVNRILTRKNQDPQWYWPEEFQKGWPGLSLVTHNRNLVADLYSYQQTDLYLGLYWGQPFAEGAKWARSQGIPVVAMNLAVWEGEDDREFFRLLLAISQNQKVESVPLPQGSLGTRGESERLASAFEVLPESLQNQAIIAGKSIGQGILYDHYVFPSFQGLKVHEEYQRLRSLCEEGVMRRYGKWTQEIRHRLDYELQVIRDKGFAGYFLVVQDIIGSRRRTCGRGSSASSIVSYLLGITHVDPLKYNLFFERFLNYGRKDPPDIDVDFPWDERDQALRDVFKKYPDRAAMVADHVTFADKSCYREPAKAYGMQEEEIRDILKWRRRGEVERIPPFILKAAGRLQGMPRHLGTHPGGVVITPDSIYRTASLHRTGAGHPLLPWEKDAAEDMGLVKIDLLGNRSLGVLRDAIHLVNSQGLEPLQWESFQPYEDEDTRQLIEAGDTLGVFYVESPATRQLLKKMGNGSYEKLVIASSIIRPAANVYINEFVARLKGKPWKPIHPVLGETLEETQGIMVYQEDVSKVAIALAGFSPADADGLRKVLSKKSRRRQLESYREQFYAGGLQQGLTAKQLGRLWEMILSFDGYSFCKAHSASYALVSYKLAYIKKRYEKIFYLAVINNGGGFYQRQVYINALKRRGYQVFPPDVNRSDYRYSLCDEGIRAGLLQINGLGESFIGALLKARDGGLFTDIGDFVRRTAPSFGDMRLLIRSGALDSLAGPYSRPQLFWVFYHFRRDELVWIPPEAPSSIKDYDRNTRLRDEVKTLGLILSTEPIRLFLPRVKPLVEQLKLPPWISSKDLEAFIGCRVTLAGVSVTRKWVKTKHQEDMSFVSFEDQWGLFETVFFPQSWGRYGLLLDEFSAFLICGLLKEEWGSVSLYVEHLVPLSRMKDTA